MGRKRKSSTTDETLYAAGTPASPANCMGSARATATDDGGSTGGGSGGNLGFEAKLWAATDKVRGHMDAGEYKHVGLGRIFLKYISDAFQERYDALKAEPHADPEDRDEYARKNVFWVPPDARWHYLKKNAKQPTISVLIDNAMTAIERENPKLKGVLAKDYARESLDKTRLGELIDLMSTIRLIEGGTPGSGKDKDILGRVYEYFLGRFAAAEGKAGGEFYTPQSVVRLLVEMIEPYKGRVLDPCCGSGGMFVQSEKFVLAHGGRLNDIAVYGQESNPDALASAVDAAVRKLTRAERPSLIENNLRGHRFLTDGVVVEYRRATTAGVGAGEIVPGVLWPIDFANPKEIFR